MTENYKIYFKKSAKKEFVKIPKPDLQRIITKIASLQGNPRAYGAAKLSGHDKYRVRQGNYRVVYAIHDKLQEIWIYKIAHRKLVYKNGL